MPLLAPTDPSLVVGVLVQFGVLDGIQDAIKHAAGPVGLVLIAVYSFLIAFILPLPSEIVLVAPINLPLPEPVEVGIVILVSALGKTAGSLVAFLVGDTASGTILDRFEDSDIDVLEWSERRFVSILQDYGYIGLALLLMIPVFPDTLSIYAFSILEKNYTRFAGATFVGSAGRLLVIALILVPFFDF